MVRASPIYLESRVKGDQFMIRLLVKGFVLLLSVSLLTCCASTGKSVSGRGDLAVTPTAPIIAYDTQAVPQVVNASNWHSAETVRQTSLSSVPFLDSTTSLKNYRPNRAFAIGFPYECGGTWHSWSYSNESSAAWAALTGCLNYLDGIEKHTGHRCGARLVMVNKQLLVSTEELPTKFRLPFILEVRTAGKEKALVYGMYEHGGTGGGLDIPFDVFNDKGDKVCEGSCSLSFTGKLLGSGKFEMNCFNGKLNGQGTFSRKKIQSRHSSGSFPVTVGKGRTSDGSELRFLMGVTIDHYEDYKSLLE